MKMVALMLIMVLLVPVMAMADQVSNELVGQPAKQELTTTQKVLHWTGRVLYFTFATIFAYRVWVQNVDPITGR